MTNVQRFLRASIYVPAIIIITAIAIALVLLNWQSIRKGWIADHASDIEYNFVDALDHRDPLRAEHDLIELQELQSRPDLVAALKRYKRFASYKDIVAQETAWRELQSSRPLTVTDLELLRSDKGLGSLPNNINLSAYCKADPSGDSSATCEIACASEMLSRSGSSSKAVTIVANDSMRAAGLPNHLCESYNRGLSLIDVAKHLDPKNKAMAERDELYKLLSVITASYWDEIDAARESNEQSEKLADMSTTTNAENLGLALGMADRANELDAEGNRGLRDYLQLSSRVERSRQRESQNRASLESFSSRYLASWASDSRWLTWLNASVDGVHPVFARWAEAGDNALLSPLKGDQLPFSRGVIACARSSGNLAFRCALISWNGDIVAI